jgi:hypothetical protein
MLAAQPQPEVTLLPFTKRPGKDESSPEVVTKESVPSPPKSSASRFPPPVAPTTASAGADRPRVMMPSISDEEMTCLMPSKSLTGMVPAAGKPKTVPPAAGMKSPAPAAGRKRVAKKPQPVEEDDDSRTVVRPGLSGAISLPKSSPSLGSTEGASPAAVIKAHLEAARAAASGAHPAVTASGAHAAVTGSGAHSALASGAVPAISDEIASFPGVEVGGSRPGVDMDDRPERTVALPPNMTPGGGVAAMPTTPLSGPVMVHPPQGMYSQPPPAGMQPMQPFVRQAAVPAPMSSAHMMGQPAHFAPHPMSEPRMDPPATVVTSATRKSSGRATMSWAVALVGVGLCVGIAAALVASGRADGVVDTTASFVDPARANKAVAAAQPKEVAKDPAAKDPAVKDPAATAAPVAQPAAPIVNTGTDPVTVPATAVDPSATAAPPATIAAAPVATAPADTAPGAVATPPARGKGNPQPAAPTPVAEKPTPAEKPPTPAKPPVAAKPPTPTPAPAAAPKKGGGDDDEMKKAAEALAKAQLENSL